MLAAGYVSGAGGGGRGFALPALSSRHGPARWSDKHGRPRPTRPWPAMTPVRPHRAAIPAEFILDRSFKTGYGRPRWHARRSSIGTGPWTAAGPRSGPGAQ